MQNAAKQRRQLANADRFEMVLDLRPGLRRRRK
jgi:hypothetical protein